MICLSFEPDLVAVLGDQISYNISTLPIMLRCAREPLHPHGTAPHGNRKAQAPHGTSPARHSPARRSPVLQGPVLQGPASFDVLEAGDMVEGCSIGFRFGFAGSNQ